MTAGSLDSATWATIEHITNDSIANIIINANHNNT